MSTAVYVVSIDIKDGWYDIIHAFSTRAVAEAYVAWQAQHSGDHCYVTEVEVEAEWVPPSPSDTLDTLESLF